MFSDMLVLVQVLGLCRGAFGAWHGGATPNNSDNNRSNPRDNANQSGFMNMLVEKLQEKQQMEDTGKMSERKSSDYSIKSNDWNAGSGAGYKSK